MKTRLNNLQKIRLRESGFSMIEVMVSLVILLLGILGLVGMIVISQRAETESYQRSQALLLLQDMVGRINANRTVASCYAFTTDTVNGAPVLGTGATLPTGCGLGSVAAYTLANADLAAWNNLLKGTTETLVATSANIGSMTGARGCVSLSSATGIYLVSVAWQGNGGTVAPGAGLACGKGLYGDETLRRVVSLPLEIANLN